MKRQKNDATRAEAICEAVTREAGCPVSSEARVRYRGNDYSVPTSHGFQEVMVKGFVDQVVIPCADEELQREVVAEAKRVMRRLATIPGVGPITAASIKALVPDPGGFKSGRNFAAWLGLRRGPIRAVARSGWEESHRWAIWSSAPCSSSVLASSVLRRVQRNDKAPKWLSALLKRRPYKVVAAALSNNTARFIWALLTKGWTYRGMAPVNRVASA